MKCKFIEVFALSLCLTVPLMAETFANYQFADKDSVKRSVDSSVGSTKEFGMGRGVIAIYATSGIAATKPGALFLSDRGFDQADEAGAVAEKDYIYCKISPKSDRRISFTNMTFYTLRRDLNNEGVGAPDNFSVYTSVDDFSKPVGAGKIEMKAGDFREFTQNTVDVSVVPTLQSVAEGVEFRIYFWASQGAGTDVAKRIFRFDDLSVSGTLE